MMADIALKPMMTRAPVRTTTAWDRLKHKLRSAVIGALQRRIDARLAAA